MIVPIVSRKEYWLTGLKAPGILLAMLGDLAIVHLSMLGALFSAGVYHMVIGDIAVANQISQVLLRLYVFVLSPLSLIFPVIFYLNGFYTRYRTYEGWTRIFVLLSGTGMALLLFLATNFLLLRETLMPRSVAVFFCIFLMAGITGTRLINSLFARRLQSNANQMADTSSERPIVLVVGGAGYIGSVLVRKLLARGKRVRVLDNLVYGDQAIREVLNHPELELMVGDCRNIQSVVAALKGVSEVIHLAAIVGDPACDQERQAALEINYAATRMMIEVAKGNGIRRFIFASSCSVYGMTDYTMDERSAVHPISLYAQTKVDSEKALLEACDKNFHPTILRLATVFGNSPRPRFDLVINLLTARAFQEKVITVFNGQQWRPFIHVQDVAEGLLCVLNAPLEAVSGEVFNLGDSRMNYTLAAAAETIVRSFPETKVERIENQDRRDYRVSFDKIRQRIGFQCKWTLEDGIRELKHAFTEGTILNYQDPYYNNLKYLQTKSHHTHANGADARVMAAFVNQ